MRKNKISETIGKINEKYVNEATVYAGQAKAARHGGWLKWGSIAACLCIIAIGLAAIMPKINQREHGGHGDVIEDREPIVVSIEKWQDEGFRCKVINPDIHEFLSEGLELLIQFETKTKVVKTDGTEFVYNDQDPNAKDCGLLTGTIVQVYFKAVEYDDNGMADRIYAQKVIPQS